MLIDPYEFRPATIAEIVRESPRAVSVRLDTVETYTFVCGQHAVVRVKMPDGSKLVRQYSFSSAPETGELWLTIVHEPHGEVSGWFKETAKTGDSIELSHPFMGPLVQETPRGEICMIAGGSGIAPLRAMLQQQRLQGYNTATLLYSTRKDEVCFQNELAPLPGEHITYRLTDSEPRFLEQDVIARLTPKTTVFICGSREFVMTMRHFCETIVPPEHIHSEAFSL